MQKNKLERRVRNIMFGGDMSKNKIVDYIDKKFNFFCNLGYLPRVMSRWAGLSEHTVGKNTITLHKVKFLW